MHTLWFRAHPEVRSITFGDGVAGLEAIFSAIHSGEFAGVPATGTSVEMPYSVFYQLSGERITALRAYFPQQALIEQLRSASPAP